MAKTAAAKKRLRAVVRISYPRDQKSYNAILRAGGLSKMSDEDKAALDMGAAAPGEFCDDLLPCHRDHWLRLGRVVEVEVKQQKKVAKKKGGSR